MIEISMTIEISRGSTKIQQQVNKYSTQNQKKSSFSRKKTRRSRITVLTETEVAKIEIQN